MRTCFAFLCLGLITITPVAAAEATTGTLVGTVTSAGAPVAGAQVHIASPSGVYASTSDAHGTFTILGIVPD